MSRARSATYCKLSTHLTVFRTLRVRFAYKLSVWDNFSTMQSIYRTVIVQKRLVAVEIVVVDEVVGHGAKSVRILIVRFRGFVVSV